MSGPLPAEGIAVINVGALTFPIVREPVADVLLVDAPALARAQRLSHLAEDHGRGDQVRLVAAACASGTTSWS